MVSANLLSKTLSIIKEQFILAPNVEITIEINPATLDSKKMDIYLGAGVNRFSVGAQTFDDKKLKHLGREHSAQNTLDTLQFLKQYGINYNFDLIFGLPNQSFANLEQDLAHVKDFRPNHISPYCLTLPEKHPLNENRPSEDMQVEMFALIKDFLLGLGYDRYEISNFALPGFYSRHNSTYWSGDSYLGFGLSSHSYQHTEAPWGVRYWNPKSINDYIVWATSLGDKVFLKPFDYLAKDHIEFLQKNQALTDFTHTSLRTSLGLNMKRLGERFGHNIAFKVQTQIDALAEAGLVAPSGPFAYSLTDQGVLLSNQVFRDLTYLPGELD